MNKIVSRKTTSAMFLAIVLVLGTIILMSPSFMTNTQAASDRERDYDDNDGDKKSYDKDDSYDSRYSSYKDDYNSEYSSYDKDDSDYDKSKKDSSSSVYVKKVKCNNINVNLNGLDVNVGLPNNGPIAVVQEDDDEEEQESNSSESNNDESDEGREGQLDSDTNSRIVCINNNNNIVVGEEPPEPLTCEECFTENLSEEQLNNLTRVLADSEVSNLEGLCEALSNATLTNQEKITGLSFLFLFAGITNEDTVLRVLECLEELGLIIVPSDFEFPPGPT